ncbi:hypothetical protein OSB04_001884 [Centaurea solstitialis]|uniref:F-box domain-containing protein n=1 Tax=Centaurea solstitialis TaxID=347529 RepID=A0AA38TRT6_9ASTR|nr:hypothetical protein OSB04_001884 [Centaurea solstitialis]
MKISFRQKGLQREPSSTMAKTPRDWLQMPDEIMGGMILQRLGAIDILMNAQKVCRNWRRICKDPAMWRVIDMDYFRFDNKHDAEKLCKQAVHRSRGELIDITIDGFGTDDLLNRSAVHFVALNGYLMHSSSKLKSLWLMDCYSITRNGLVHALKRLPCLETLDLFDISINAEDIKVIGQSCPQLKSFKMNTRFMECDGDAFAIANSMPALRHLQLFSDAITNDGLQAILHGCPRLESLHLSRCVCLELDGNLEKLCRERIKDLKFTTPFKGCWCFARRLLRFKRSKALIKEKVSLITGTDRQTWEQEEHPFLVDLTKSDTTR